MIIRNLTEVSPVAWGNGLSHRLITDNDGMGFAVAHTIVDPGTRSALEYKRHLEACYCISGHGQVISADGGKVHEIQPGVIYALDQHDPHYLVADGDAPLQLVSIFNPPLNGDERHRLTDDGFSHY
jgi:L-ectoine synthase